MLGGFPQSSRGQSASNDIQAGLAAATSSEDAVHKGLLFSAVAPVTEDALKRLDRTRNAQSFTMPLTVDRAYNRLYVQAKIDNKSIRLILDTGGGPMVGLDDAAARGMMLTGNFSSHAFGSQGNEAVTVGLAQSLTLGTLTLQQVLVSVAHKRSFYSNTFGIQALANYRITLDFAAQTMTLTRGGSLVLPNAGAALSVPFDDANGYIFVPVHVLNQDGWALLDSGSDVTSISLKAAKAAAIQISSADIKTEVTDGQIGIGNTAKKVTALVLRVPVPISVNADHDGAEFSTTSQIGMSDIDTVLDNGFGAKGSMNAQLGLPFFLQFQRIIIDYPAHTLTLQYPIKDTPLKVADFGTKHDRAWPGYKWLQKGYGWIEVPGGKNLPPPLTANAPVQAITNSPNFAGTTTTDKGTVTTTVANNGVKKVYSVPPGSTLSVNPDGSVKISPAANSTLLANNSPGSEMTAATNGTVVVNDSVVVNKALTINKSLVVNGSLTINGGLVAEEALTVNGTLVVNGAFAAKKAVTVNGAITIVSGGTTATITRGSAVVTIDGVTKVDPMPPDSGITVDNDGSIHFSPPAPDSTNAAGQTGGT